MSVPKKKVQLKDELKTFGEEIRRRRELRTLSQTALAHLVNISYKQLNNIECARNWPSMPVYLTLCKVLDAPKPSLLFKEAA